MSVVRVETKDSMKDGTKDQIRVTKRRLGGVGEAHIEILQSIH